MEKATRSANLYMVYHASTMPVCMCFATSQNTNNYSYLRTTCWHGTCIGGGLFFVRSRGHGYGGGDSPPQFSIYVYVRQKFSTYLYVRPDTAQSMHIHISTHQTHFYFYISTIQHPYTPYMGLKSRQPSTISMEGLCFCYR